MSVRPLSEFIAEANEVVDALGHDLLALDQRRGQEPDPETVNAIFRAAHSLKGMASMFGQKPVALLAHQAEDLLDAVRLGKVSLSDAVLDALVDTLDVFAALLKDAAEGKNESGERATWHAERLKQLCESSQAAAPAAAIDPKLKAVFTEYEEHRYNENVKKGHGLFKVEARFSLEDFDQKLSALNVALKPLGEVISTLPSSLPGAPNSIGFELVFGSPHDEAKIAAVASELSASVSSLKATPTLKLVESPPLAPSSGESSLRSLTQTVRVDIGRLDTLMNAVGELLLVKSNIARLAETVRQSQVSGLPKQWGQELGRESRALERKLDELQKGILDVRMVPLAQVFDKLTRLLKRLAKESRKEIDFDIAGGAVELDKLIVEELSDPLMHLLRNAIDHGIEAPEQRTAKGKNPRGRVRLKASSQGNHVLIEAGDDGAGFDEKRIREVALERKLVTQAQVDQMDRRELLNLVFLPGFSTRKNVSELSGRGVGLDVVKTNLSRLSGMIEIDTTQGQGTTFTLTLPLTLAIIRALVVKASERTYAVPLNSVLEILSLRTSELRTVERREVFSLRGQTVPFVRLSKVFGLPASQAEIHFVVVVGLAQQRFGLAVDALMGQQDIVTKPLGARLRHIAGIAGATDLGDRRAVLVLDVGALMAEQLRPKSAG